MIKIAHIINVTEIDDSKKASYLHIAQPVTMRSMVVAQNIAKNIIDVELIAIKHKDEKVEIPKEFSWASDIETYAWEHIKSLEHQTKKPLPRLIDIINGLYIASEAEYFVYTNLDIGLHPEFYLELNKMLENGHDALCINRRDITKEYESVLLTEDNLELIYRMEGELHPGIDCFVFKKKIVPSFNFNNVFVGFPPIGQVMKSQVEKYSNNFYWEKEKKLTFHLGSDLAWEIDKHPYFIANIAEAEGTFTPSFSKEKMTLRIINKLKKIFNT